MQHDFDTQTSTGPDTQDLMQLIHYRRNHPTQPWILDSQLRSEINHRLDFLDSDTLNPDNGDNNSIFPPIIDSQFTSGYDPSKPFIPAWAPTPYRRLVPTLPAPGPLFLEPFKKAALIKEGTAEAYLKLFQHGEIEARVDKKGSWELRCITECWVRTGISARIPLTTKGQFAVLEAHARGKSCKAAKANTQIQRSAIQQSRAALATIFPTHTHEVSTPFLSASESGSTIPLVSYHHNRCPGLMITDSDWLTVPNTPICANFPWLRTREGLDKLPFNIELIAQCLYARSPGCTGSNSLETNSASGPVGCCYDCASLAPKLTLLAKNAEELRPHTRRSLYTPVQLLEGMKRLDEDMNILKLQGVNHERKIQHLRSTLSDNSALIMALSQQDVPYLRQLLTTSLRNGASVRAILRTLEDALKRGYRPRNHRQESLDIAALIYRLGGRNLLYAMTQRFPLPSLRTLRNHTSFVKIAPTVGRITSVPISHNLQKLLFDTRKPGAPQRGVSVLIDETALDEAAVYIPELNAVGGLCWLHAHNVDISLRSYQSSLNIVQSLKDEKVHLAKEISVVVVRLFGEDGVYPLLAAPTCKREQANDMEFILTTVIDTYVANGGEDFVGPIWSIATDCDATRRKACHHLLVREKLPINNSLYGILSNLPGLNLFTGARQITLDPDFKHNIKRCSTALRSRTGIYINSGHAINTFMLEHYLTWVEGIDEASARRLLYPDDPQDVPRAVELLDSIIKLRHVDLSKLQSGIFDLRPDATTISDFDALLILSHIYESLLEPFINVTLSLSEQITSLSRLAHLLFACYRDQGRRFLPNQLYYDLQSMIKSAVFNVAKQQQLDPGMPYAIVEGGDDALESLFAFLRMSGGHHSALNHREANDRLGAARDIASIFSRNPDLNHGHRRLNLKRKESVDHVSRSNWVGDIVSGNCDLLSCWIRGHTEAVDVLKNSNIGSSHYDFSTDFSSGDIDLLRVFGGNKYPGLDLGGDEEEEPSDSARDHNHSKAVVDGTQEPNTCADDTELEPSFEDALISSMQGLDIGCSTLDNEDDEADNEEPNDKVGPAELDSSPHNPPKGPGVNAADYLWCERRWVHKQSVCRIVITPNFTPKSHDRLMRVRGFTAINKYSHGNDTSRILHGDQFIVGDIFLSLVRTHDKQLALGLFRATGIFENGSPRSSVHTDTLKSLRGNVKVNGDIMILVPSQKIGDPLWVWNGSFGSHTVNTPGSTTPSARVSSLSIAGHLIEPVNPPVLDASEHLLPNDRQQINSKGTTWVISDAALKEVIAVLWKTITDNKIALTTIAGLSGSSEVFPYRDVDNSSSLVCVTGTDQLTVSRGKGGTSLCPICGTKTADIRSHMGIHILRATRGVSEPGEVIERITGTLPCGFCGQVGEPTCAVTIKELSKSIQYTTNCPRMEKFQYGSASRGSNNRPCCNVPVVCKLCTHIGRETDARPGIWRYNMEAHLDYHHPEYAHPGKPVGRPLPSDVYDSLYLTEEEQRVANVSPRSAFTNVQEKENDNTSARTKKRKQDADTFGSAAVTTAKRGRRV